MSGWHGAGILQQPLGRAAGIYGATPSELAGLDPLGIGPSVLASEYFNQLPVPNDAGLDGNNIMTYKFTAPFTNTFNTSIGRVDYRPSGNHSIFGRFNVQRDTLHDVPQYLGQPPNTSRDSPELGDGDRVGLGDAARS